MSLVNKQHNEAMASGLTSEPKPVVWAADDNEDCMFCLLQTRYHEYAAYQVRFDPLHQEDLKGPGSQIHEPNVIQFIKVAAQIKK
jgi:hypothetical protein